MARVTPQRAPAPDVNLPEEDYTPVISKATRRRLRLKEREQLKKDKNPHFELPRLPRRAPACETPSVEQPSPAPGPIDSAPVTPHGRPTTEVDLTDRGSEDQDQDQDQDRGRTNAPLQRGETEKDQDSCAPPVWRLKEAGTSFTTRCQAIRWMEVEEKLKFRVNVSPVGDFLIRASSWDDASALEDFVSRQPRGIVLERRELEVRGVIVGFPVHFPLDPIAGHPAVVTAERCLYRAGRGRRLPTRSVRVTMRGKLPSTLDLGCWGRFACRRFVPEPLRCFRCQAFGHHQRTCNRETDICGACGGDHSTRDCVQRLREGVDVPVPRCVNCGDRHFAWHRGCPVRLRRITGARTPTRAAKEMLQHPLAATETAPPGAAQRKRGRRQRRRRKGTRVLLHPTTRSTWTAARGSAASTQDEATGVHLHPTSRSTWTAARGSAASTREEATGVHLHPTSRSTWSAERRSTASNQDTSTMAKPGHTARITVGEGTVRKEPRTTAQNSAPRSRASQTRGCWTFSEAELEDLLIRYEHLMAQERKAQEERNSHEPALQCMKRHLREGKDVPSTLPVGRPLQNPPRCRYHRGEKDWVHYKAIRAEEKKATEEEEAPATDPPKEEQTATAASTTDEDPDYTDSLSEAEYTSSAAVKDTEVQHAVSKANEKTSSAAAKDSEAQHAVDSFPELAEGEDAREEEQVKVPNAGEVGMSVLSILELMDKIGTGKRLGKKIKSYTLQ